MRKKFANFPKHFFLLSFRRLNMIAIVDVNDEKLRKKL